MCIATPTANLPYAMFLTRLIETFMETILILTMAVMTLLISHASSCPKTNSHLRSDRASIHSVSSSSSIIKHSHRSTHDMNDENTSKLLMHTPSPYYLLNSLVLSTTKTT
ncbi:hypothetical protein Tco_0995017 [Tanacetum coccineum]